MANRLDAWPRTNTDLARYIGAREQAVDGPASAAARKSIEEQITSADVVICIVGQTTFLDPWVDWELTLARKKPARHGLVAIMLDDLYGRPPALLNAGTMFIPLRQTFVMDAIGWAMDQTDPTEDYTLED